MDELLGYCYQAIERLLKTCPHENIKLAAQNLTYDVFINDRLGTTYGYACRKGARRSKRKPILQNHLIEFNFTLMSHIDPAERFDTVAHELAHILDSELREARSNHKGPWLRLALWLGSSGKRCGPKISKTVPIYNRKIKVVYGDDTFEYITKRRYERQKMEFVMMNLSKPGTVKKIYRVG